MKGVKKTKKHKKRKMQKRGSMKKRGFVKLNCSPENKDKQKDYTCYSETDLLNLRSMWNQRHPDKPIISTDPKQIWLHLRYYYHNICNKESCWIRKMTKNTKLEKELLDAFAPKSPDEWKKKPNMWLSSVDILEVMSQYEKKYKCFDFIGPSPIDYNTHKLNGDCVWEELCEFSLKNHIKAGKTKIGVIFNTDPHYKGGEHWISLFINVKKATIFFFDSAGDKIPNRINNFVETVTKQGAELTPPIHFTFDQNNPVEHQYKNTECGIYSIFFIVHMLEDKITSHYLKTHILKDEFMEQFRKVYFNEDL